MNWTGVMPAMTTAFDKDYNVDHSFVARHAQWLVENGCTGIVCLGSLGEAPTLRFNEKIEILKTVVTALGGKAPTVAAVSALSTAEAVDLAKAAQAVREAREHTLWTVFMHIAEFSLLTFIGSTIAGESGAIVGAISGLVLAWMGLHFVNRLHSPDQRFQPYIRN